MNTVEEGKPVIVLTGTYWEAAMLKSMLENADIQAFLYGTEKGLYNPGWTLPGEDGSVRVAISSLDLERAKPVVDAYLENQK